MPKSKPQYEFVIEIMKQNGGYATLGYLNQTVDTSTWKTKTPFATIRRIVQDERFFFKIKPGLWALKSEREKVLKKFDILQDSPKKQELFDHSYYQGLIVEIGNIKGFNTFVPNQDKNRKYLGKPLKDITGVENIYKFSYDEIIGKAKTVDVIWFNERKLPTSFFEVEHSTDFYNSFLKYCELQDFYSNFYIVSSEKKKKQFDSKIKGTAFSEMKERIKFIGYDTVSDLHTHVSAQAKVSKDLF